MAYSPCYVTVYVATFVGSRGQRGNNEVATCNIVQQCVISFKNWCCK